MTIHDAAAIAVTSPVPAGDTGRLSNHLTHLAHEAGQAWQRHKAATVEAAETYIEAGNHLAAARRECGHGEWLPFLDLAGIPLRTAQNMMRIAQSGLTADEIVDAGGIRAALAALATSRSGDDTDPESGAEPEVPAPEQPERDAAAGDAVAPALARQQRWAALRAQGLCTGCKQPADGKWFCADCAAARNDRRRRRRVLARVGEAVAAPAFLDELAGDDPDRRQARLDELEALIAAADGAAELPPGGSQIRNGCVFADGPEDGS